MSAENPHCDPTDRAKIELHALGRCVMPHDDNSFGRKIVTLVFVTVWAAVTLGLAFESVAVVTPPYYGLFTAIVFLIVGRQWDIEVERLLPTSTQLQAPNQEDDDDK